MTSSFFKKKFTFFFLTSSRNETDFRLSITHLRKILGFCHPGFEPCQRFILFDPDHPWRVSCRHTRWQGCPHRDLSLTSVLAVLSEDSFPGGGVVLSFFYGHRVAALHKAFRCPFRPLDQTTAVSDDLKVYVLWDLYWPGHNERQLFTLCFGNE